MRIPRKFIEDQIKTLADPDKSSFDNKLLAFLKFWAFLKIIDRNLSSCEILSAINMMSEVCFYIYKMRSLSGDDILRHEDAVNIANILVKTTQYSYLDTQFDRWESDSFAYLGADIIRFLISYEPESDHLKDRASINKARFFFNMTGGFGRKWSYSKKGFNDRWMSIKEISIFTYVSSHQSGDCFNVDLSDPKSILKIRMMIEDRSFFQIFFGKTLWAYNALRKRCDPQLFNGYKFPKMPPTIVEVPNRNASLTKAQKTTMADYTSGF